MKQMKHRILQVLQKKPVKHGIRAALCLLLALMMATSDTLRNFLPPLGAVVTEAADTEEAAKEKELTEVIPDFVDHTLYKWKLRHGYKDIPGAMDGNHWVPVIIGYVTYGGKNYYLKTGNGDIFAYDKTAGRVQAKMASWDDLMKDMGYPSIHSTGYDGDCWNSQNEFWTVDDRITDVGIWRAGVDDEYGTIPTFEIGTNIEWNNAYSHDACHLMLCYDDTDECHFTYYGADYWTSAAKAYEETYRWFSFIGDDEHGRQEDTGIDPSMGMIYGQTRILSMVDDGWDFLLKYDDAGHIYPDSDSKYDYGGEFYVWAADTQNLPTIEAKSTQFSDNGLNTLPDLTKVTGDVTVGKNQFFNIKNDIRIAQNAILVVEPGGVVTIDATLWNDGTIINYGTIFIRENGCIRPLCAKDSNGKYLGGAGRLICSGSTDNGKTLTGEGNLVMFKDSTLIFNYNELASNMFFIKDGASVELNGTIFSPNFFQLINSDFHIRESGQLICQKKASTRFVSPKVFAGKETSKHFSLSEVNKTNDPISIYEAGNYKFVNDGKFTKVTEPGTTLPKSAAEVAAEEQLECEEGCSQNK